ncbi:MAG: hypothetical protein O3C40_09040 [Planctomycetota bacterium]|nr:hypothetical protein [Planctomycetota bacterium]
MTRTRLLIVVTIGIAFLWCFGSVLFRDRSFGFRDAANYYYPLFEWECHEWRAGRVPLWNPLDNAGTPVLADTTSSVLYPGKLVFALPVSYRLRYHIYVTAHILLAAAMAYRLARHWSCSREASGLAALSYAFGGSVLFQYCNVVFLVGAAWLPFGLLAADRMLRERSLGWAVALGAVLALMTLGGDPQAAYHMGMLAAFYACLLPRDSASPSVTARIPWRRSRPALLAVAAIAGLCLALVQILPAAEWTRQSNRDAPDAPRNVYEAAATLTAGAPTGTHPVASGLVGTPQPATHLRHVYEFSVGPWHAIEFIWPNFFGHIFPTNDRWSTVFSGEGRTWTPSLYLGLLPLVLAICSWRVRRGDARLRFVSLLTLLALLASFGWYGVGWLVHEIRASLLSQAPDELTLGQPVGGVYWMFVTLLPGYVYFRFPAKLLVVASLGISMLAARGWDDFVEAKPRRIANTFAVIAAISLMAAAGFGLCQTSWNRWLADASADRIFGPLDTEAATSCILTAFLHAAVLGLAYWFLLRATHEHLKQTRGILLLAMTAFELCVANGWMTLSIPGSVWSERQFLAEAIVAETDTSVPPRLFRDSSATLLPKAWSEQGDEARLADVVAWERATLLPQHHLRSDIAMIGSQTTLASADWQSFLRVARQWDRDHASDQAGELLRSMSAQFIATPGSVLPTGNRELITTSGEGVRLYADSRALPRTWIVHDIQVIPPLADRSRTAIDRRTREVFFDGERPRDLRAVAMLEAEETLRLPKFQKLGNADEAESCVVMHYSPPRVEIEVSLTEPGCLVFNDTYYPGWHAVRVTDGVTKELAIFRANRLMRAVLLPAGQHRVVYSYRPQRVVCGGFVSGCSWLLLVAYGIRWARISKAKQAGCQ